MSLEKYFQLKGSTMDVLASAGTIGLHMVSGPMVGFAIGYGLDYWLDTSPWFKLIFFVIGIIAGFKNVYDDTQHLLRKIQAEDDQRRGITRDADGREMPTAQPATGAAEDDRQKVSPTTPEAVAQDTVTPDSAAEIFAAEQAAADTLPDGITAEDPAPLTEKEAEKVYNAVLDAHEHMADNDPPDDVPPTAGAQRP